MKEDIPWNHGNNLLPILDTQMDVVGGNIVHHHYAKKMSSLEVVLRRSTMSMGAKLSILVQEGCRRLRNCSIDLPWSTKLVHLNKLMVQMRWAEYSQKTRGIVAERILGKLDNNMRNYEYLQRPLYRELKS